jgi:hypothetical protein
LRLDEKTGKFFKDTGAPDGKDEEITKFVASRFVESQLTKGTDSKSKTNYDIEYTVERQKDGRYFISSSDYMIDATDEA